MHANTAAMTRREPKGPCDIYAAANYPCVAANSTTSARYDSDKGPMYQVKSK